tara:strand:+ start:103 stop:363 length:261 start_codon:yes stop_codon:yes gene_type:complete
MSSFLQYSDYGYTPGEVYRSGMGKYGATDRMKIRNARRKDFRSAAEDPMGMGFTADRGAMFEQFLNLQRNPAALMPQLPSDLQGYM